MLVHRIKQKEMTYTSTPWHGGY